MNIQKKCFHAAFIRLAKKFGMHNFNFLTLLILQIVIYYHNYYAREINRAQRDNFEMLYDAEGVRNHVKLGVSLRVLYCVVDTGYGL